MSMSHDEAVASMLEEGLDDWVPSQSLIWHGQEVAAGSGVSLEDAVSRLVVDVIARGLMAPGELGDGGFELWAGSPAELLARVLDDCRQFEWSPQGAGCWLANTADGDRLAAEASAARAAAAAADGG